MDKEPLKFLSSETLEKLSQNVEASLDRYISRGFADLTKENGWEIDTAIAKWDPAVVDGLDPSGSPEAEIQNSLLIFTSMDGMTPALAREERLWARLCHVECLEYARRRWLADSRDIARQVRLHFFAPNLTGCRDDNAIGRLWWNGHVASLASPSDLELGLQRLLSRANVRLQIVDRADTAFREPLVRGIVRLLGEEPWFDSYDAAIADFMYEVNKRSGGIIFEAFDDAGVDQHLGECLKLAKLRKVS